MRVSASYSNVEAMKMKLNILMNIYPWVDMVVYSELCAYGPLTHHALTRIEDFEEQMQELAQRHKVWLLPGSVFHKVDGLIYNTASVIDPQGNVVKRYRKMFPFYPYEVGVTPGHEFCLFEVPEVGRFGVSICYDMWFPETTRTLAVHGAEVILHPTLTGTIDREIELSIVRASAAINQCFIFDINGLDTGGSGRSIICGPDGRVTYQAQNNEEMIPIEINIDRVRRSRELGLLRLGQPLKSFRDHLGDFDIYRKEVPKPYLDSLGPLIKPQRVKELGDLQILEESVVPGRNVFSSSIPTDNTDPGAIS